jgi:ribose transport system substrate-binding protein
MAVAVVALGLSSNSPRASAATGKTYTIVLSNSVVNTWRTEMQNIVKAMVVNNPPYKGHVHLNVIVSQASPSGQIQSLDNIISERPNAILVDAVSPTALNPVVQRACSMHIVVVFFDQWGPQENKCAYRVRNDESGLFRSNALWLAKTLHGHGNVIEDEGLPGAPLEGIALNAASAVFKSYPGIHVVARYAGDYAPGPSKQAVTSIITSNTVNGVYAISGTPGIVQAFLGANKKLVPISSFGETGVEIVHLIDQYKPQGFQVQLAQDGPSVGGQALEVAWDALTGKSPFADKAWGFAQGADAKDVLLPNIVYNTNGIKPPGFPLTPFTQLQQMASGLPSTTELPISLPQSPVSAKEVLGG